jgi:hypothetical protein
MGLSRFFTWEMTSRNLLTEWVATFSNRGDRELSHYGQQQLAIAFIPIGRVAANPGEEAQFLVGKPIPELNPIQEKLIG